MNTTTWTIASGGPHRLARVADYCELAKPRISVMVLLVVAVSAVMASWGQPDIFLLCHVLIGTTLVAASGSALNQWIECKSDKLMDRTCRRPLPAGRLGAHEVMAFGLVSLAGGLIYLVLNVGLATASWASITWLLYVMLYTPLKRRTPLNTAVGAVAGALPVLIGWTAVGGVLDARCAAFFLIVFLWQFPHFMAIAWIYRRQYAQADLQMSTVVDPSGRGAGVQAVSGALALLPVSFVPALMVPGASSVMAVALALGLIQLAFALAFLFVRNDLAARLLFRATLVYLPALLLLFTLMPFA